MKAEPTSASGLGHNDLKRMVDLSSTETEPARTRSEQCRDYYDSKQWTAEELSVFKKRKQPALVINRIKRKVDSIVGIEQKGRVDPRGLPRNPDDEQAADIATKALVFVEDITRFDSIRSQFCYNLAIEGYGGVEVNVRQRPAGLDPDLIRLRWEEIFYDPYSRELDFSDAEYVGVQKWMSLEGAVAFAKGYNPELDDDTLTEMLRSSMSNSAGTTYDDRPASASTSWGNEKKKRVKLVYMYYRCEGTWYLALLCGGGVIHNEVSPFLDYADDPEGKPACAIILQSCYVDRDNQRYGVVLDWISAQDEVNKRRSKALHMLNSRQTMGQRGAVADVRIMKRELALPDGHVEYDQDVQSSVPSFQIIPNQDQLKGQLELLQESKGEIDMLGPNASLLGQLEGAQSGRAIIAQQQAGMAELAPFYDNLRDWTLRVYRAMWNRIRQFWKEPRWIRVTDETEGLQFLGINQPKQEPVVDPMTGEPMAGPDGQPMMRPVIDPQTGQPMLDNEVGALDIDIIIDMTPEYASLQQEEFQSLVELMKSGAVQFPPEVLIEASSLRNKAKILEKMKGDPEQAAAAQQAQQAAMQAQMAQLQATVEKLAAEAENKKADTAKKIAETEQIRQETMLEPAKVQHDMANDQESHEMDRARFGEEANRARVSEAREGVRMQEDLRSSQTSEQMAREKQAADIEFARQQAANPNI